MGNSNCLIQESKTLVVVVCSLNKMVDNKERGVLYR